MLSAAAQLLFARLGVFVGGCTLDAAKAVCNADGALAIGVTDGVASLVDKSLLRLEAGMDGEPRVLMLETIREYTLERLEASGEADALHLRGAAERLRAALGCRLAPATRVTYEHSMAIARAQIGEEAFAVAWAAGRAMALEQAIAEALDGTNESRRIAV